MSSFPVILDGKLVSEGIKDNVRQRISTYSRHPKLVIIQVGGNPASEVYVANKERACASVGIDVEIIRFSENEKPQKVYSLIEVLNMDDRVDAIFVQFPLPEHFSERKCRERIHPDKDADGLNSDNMKLLGTGKERLIPCTPAGIIKLVETYDESFEGKDVTIIGRSDLVGRPLARLLSGPKYNATVTLCHSHTNNLCRHVRKADIVVCAVGKLGFLTREYFNFDNNRIIVDVGINRRRSDGKLVGDIDLDLKDIPYPVHITPVPGGVGPMTVASLLENVCKCFEINNA